jgi:hypothetical protein
VLARAEASVGERLAGLASGLHARFPLEEATVLAAAGKTSSLSVLQAVWRSLCEPFPEGHGGTEQGAFQLAALLFSLGDGERRKDVDRGVAHEDEIVRQAVASALRYARSGEPILVQALGDRSRMVRWVAAASLGTRAKQLTPETRTRLRTLATHDPESEVRFYAAAALPEDDQTATEALRALLDQGNRGYFQADIAFRLAQRRDRAGIERLKALLFGECESQPGGYLYLRCLFPPIYYLDRLGTEEALGLLRKAREAGHNQAASLAAALALARRGDRRLPGCAARALAGKDGAGMQRLAAAVYLAAGQHVSPRGVPPQK